MIMGKKTKQLNDRGRKIITKQGSGKPVGNTIAA